ncbi:MAG: hypothetical protein Kow0089_15460 [Desulfobulbaceae bacterium]
MKNCFNATILSLALAFGLLLGVVDTLFDWLYHSDGGEPFFVYLVTSLQGHEIVWRGTFLLLALLFGLIVSCFYNRKIEARAALDNILNSVIPVCITDNDHTIVMANKSYYRIFGMPEQGSGPLKCYQHRPGPSCQTEKCPLEAITRGGRGEYTCESVKKEEGRPDRTFIVTASPYFDGRGRQVGIVESFQEITERKELEEERERLLARLNEALAEVKKLSGFLPICASCKKIRDDRGYWKDVEAYVTEHSEAKFSHSICPECAARHYARFSKEKERDSHG